MTASKLSCVFQLDMKDFFQFNYVINKKVIQIMMLYGVIMFLVIVGFELAKEKVNFIPILLGAIIILATFGVLFLNMYKKSKKGWALNPAFHDSMKLEFDDRGFVCTTLKNSASIPWKKVMRVLESRKMVVIVISATQAYMLPKRVENIEKIKKIIKSNCDTKTCKIK